MAQKIEAPFVGTEVDPSDMGGSAKNVVYGLLGIVLAIAMLAGGQTLYNLLAENTPDAVEPVEVF